jgi:hypothetical protein
MWTDDKKATIRDSIVNFGLKFGAAGHAAGDFWTKANGNWNCVSNGGIIMGCLAIQGDDTTGACDTLLKTALDNALQYCTAVPQGSGSGSETPNYWYFAMTGWAELTSSLQVATGGGEFGMISTNPSFNLTALFHMYVTGMTSLFDYGGWLFYDPFYGILTYAYDRSRSE